jgi:hypothetical protein
MPRRSGGNTTRATAGRSKGGDPGHKIWLLKLSKSGQLPRETEECCEELAGYLSTLTKEQVMGLVAPRKDKCEADEKKRERRDEEDPDPGHGNRKGAEMPGSTGTKSSGNLPGSGGSRGETRTETPKVPASSASTGLTADASGASAAGLGAGLKKADKDADEKITGSKMSSGAGSKAGDELPGSAVSVGGVRIEAPQVSSSGTSMVGAGLAAGAGGAGRGPSPMKTGEDIGANPKGAKMPSLAGIKPGDDLRNILDSLYGSEPSAPVSLVSSCRVVCLRQCHYGFLSYLL